MVLSNPALVSAPSKIPMHDLIAVIPRELCELFLPITAIKLVRLPKVILAVTIRQ